MMKLVIYTVCVLLVAHLGCKEAKEIDGDRSGYIKVGNLQVYFERDGTGEPLLLIHAGLQDHTMWESQVKELSKQLEIITIDLPYHGKSSGIDTTILVQDVIKIILDSLQLNKINIAGVSMGAAVTQDFVIAYPALINKVILISSGINGYDKIQQVDSLSLQWYRKFVQALEQKDTALAAREFTIAWAEGVYRPGDSLQSAVSKYVYDKTLSNLRLHRLAGWPRLQSKPPAIENISKITQPVLIIDGDKDLPYITTSSDYLEKNIRGAKRVKLKDVAHMLNMEKPNEVSNLISDFIKGK